MGVATSVFSRDATPLAEDLLGGEGRADDLSFLLSQLKDMGEDAIPTLGQIPGLIERASSDKLVVRLLRAQGSALTNGQHSDTDRMTRAILGAALFVPDMLCRMTVGWSPLPITLFVKGLMLMVRQVHLARRKESQGRRGHPPLLGHGNA